MPKSKKTIWIINQYASTPQTGMGGRHYYFAKGLATLGYDVVLVAASYNHLLRTSHLVKKSVSIQQCENFKLVLLQVPEYRNSRSAKRVFNWIIFSRKVKSLLAIVDGSPDYVFVSSPALTVYNGAEKLARKAGAKLIFEVRDIWPLTLTKVGNLSSLNPLILWLKRIEKRAYKESDLVVSNLSCFERYFLKQKSKGNYLFLPNGFDKSEFSNIEPVKEKPDFVIGYCGTLGRANELNTFLYAAHQCSDIKGLRFEIVGDGVEKTALKRLSEHLNLQNLSFYDAVKKSEVSSVLARFDACYLGWYDSELYQFGIGANKIPEYLYSGRLIIQAYSGEGDTIQKSKAGFTVPAQNVTELVNMIKKVADMPLDKRSAIAERAKEYAETKLEYNVLSSILADKLKLL